MRYIHTLIIFALSFISSAQPYFADNYIFDNNVLNENIKSIQLHREEWNLSYPVIRLNSEDRLAFNFDCLGDNSEPYYYTFIHCDKDWKKSDIFPNDFIEGFSENPVEEYEASFNTTVKYYHYKIVFPNQRVKIRLSGNYILCIYSADNPSESVILQKFIVSEDAARINVSVHRPLMNDNKNTHQQIDFTVSQMGADVLDPYKNIYAFVLQNGRWDSSRKYLKPEFYGNNELKYSSLSDKNIFRGGNEFRYFDIKSIRYQTEYVKGIEFISPNYNVYLFPSENREFKPYFYWQDFNGKYFVAYQEGRKPDVDADYVYVIFTLPSKQKIAGGDMYITGSLNNWQYNQNNRMTYNPQREQYECMMLLKQGWYNYEYQFLKTGESSPSLTLFEGSHYETENDYTILIYYRNPRGRYDRVIGTITANTLNKIIN